MLKGAFKKLLEDRGMTQSELAEKAGLAQSYISKLCRGHFNNIGMKNYDKIARALHMTPDQLSRELSGEQAGVFKPTFEEQLELIKLSAPVSIPVYDSIYFHAGRGRPMEAIDHIPLPREFVANKKLEAYIVHGSCMAPVIKDGDAVVVDPDAPCEHGNYVACQCGDRFIIGKFKQIGEALTVENGMGQVNIYECSRVARIVKLTRNL